MKVLVVAHRLDIGGTQTNATELASHVQKHHGVDVVMAAAPGPAAAWAADRGVDLRLLPDADRHPSTARVRALTDIAQEVRPDLVHVWDWPQCFDAYPGLHLRMRLPVLCTCMGMVVPRFIPRHLVTTFGTRELAESARRTRRGTVHLLEPPVDVDANRPGVVDGEELRTDWGIAPDELLVAMVSRLESWLKLESLTRTIAAVSELVLRHRVRLLVVGEGSALSRVQQLADEVNARHGSPLVQLTGGLIDPRPAYEAADVMVGMGGSALRTMAFATPLVVVGERGFSRVLDEDSLPTFLHQGWYGIGDGRPDDLTGQIERLLDDDPLRRALGAVGLQAVHQSYTLDAAARQLVSWYDELTGTRVPLGTAVGEAVRTIALRSGRSALAGLSTLRPSFGKEK